MSGLTTCIRRTSSSGTGSSRASAGMRSRSLACTKPSTSPGSDPHIGIRVWPVAATTSSSWATDAPRGTATSRSAGTITDPTGWARNSSAPDSSSCSVGSITPSWRAPASSVWNSLMVSAVLISSTGLMPIRRTMPADTALSDQMAGLNTTP